MSWDLVGYVLAGMWNGMVFQVWILLCILGLVITVLSGYDTLTKDRTKDEV